ncbi:MAG: hypothetical protein M1825_002272 [Sarcosagium campestre]|nr:MAG: hypothetical protein M1825_002272 [Sarcosagium campestre]
MVGGIAVYATAAYGTYLYMTYRRAAEESMKLEVPDDVSDRYNDQADTFDADVATTEWLMGLTSLRQKLAAAVHGEVLETSVGTSRNFQFYPIESCSRLVMVDKSPEMIAKAESRFKALYPDYGPVTFLAQDAGDPVQCQSPGGFDTVIQTMGLCSAAQPVKMLQNLGALVNQRDGQILLLEHGKSHYRWLDGILDSLANAHAHRYGCWWNRDIGQIVKDSGLELVELKRYNFGTTWWIRLRPARRQTAENS